MTEAIQPEARGELSVAAQALVADLAGRPLAALEALAAFWLRDAGSAAPEHLAERIVQAMTSRRVLAERLGFLLHEDRAVLRRIVGERRLVVTREMLLERSVGSAPVDAAILDRTIDRLRERGFVEVTRGTAWNDLGRITLEMPAALGQALGELLAGELRPIDHVMTLAAYLGTLSHNRQAERLDRFSRAGGREEQKKRAIARCRDGAEIDRRLAAMPERLARALTLTRDRFHGLAFRAELAAIDPLIDREWDEPSWRELAESALIGTVGAFTLTEHGIGASGDAVVVFAEVVNGTRHAPSPPPPPGVVLGLGYDFLALVEALFAEAQLASPRVTRKDSLLFRGVERRLADAFAQGSTARRLDAARAVQSAVLHASRSGHVDVDDRGRLIVRPQARAWLGESPAARRRDALESLIAAALATAHVPIDGDDLRAVVASLPSQGWVELADLAWRVRALVVRQRLPDRHYPLSGMTTVDKQKAAAELGLATPAQIFEVLLAPFYLTGVLEVGIDAESAARPGDLTAADIIGVRRATGARLGALVASGDTPESPPVGRVLVVNPSFEVLVFPERDGTELDELLVVLERYADRQGGAEPQVITLHLCPESVRRGIAAGGSEDELFALFTAHARTPLPRNVEYSLRDWCRAIVFVDPRAVVVLDVATSEQAERIHLIAARHQVEVRVLEGRVVLVPAEALDPTAGAAFIAALQAAGVLLAPGSSGP